MVSYEKNIIEGPKISKKINIFLHKTSEGILKTKFSIFFCHLFSACTILVRLLPRKNR